MSVDRQHKKAIFVFFAIVVVIIGLWIFLEVIGYMGIRMSAQEIVKEAPNDEIIINNLLMEVKSIMTFTYNPVPFCRPIYAKNPNLIFVLRRGACEETATLFAEMANASGFQCRKVHAPGENHVWNEVLINGSWKRADATLEPPSNYDNFSFYESPEGWNWKLSKVYSNVDGRILDRSDDYTGSGTLNVFVKEGDKPLENVEVIIKSHFRMEHEPDKYKAPIKVTTIYPDANGTCTINLGENNYTIVAKRKQFFKYCPFVLQYERNSTLEENKTQNETFSFPRTTYDPIITLLLSLLIIIGGLLLIILKIRRYFEQS
jgi:hypothetical protein